METPKLKAKFDRATNEQLKFYVNFCRERPQLLTGKKCQKSSRQMQELWNKLAIGLNAVRGPTRTAPKWKKTLTVWKSHLRIRARRLQMNQRVTGGESNLKPMSDFEELALSTFGLAAIEGATSSGSFGLTVPQQAIAHKCVTELPLVYPDGSMLSPECSLPSPERSQPSPECSLPSPEFLIPNPSRTRSEDSSITENVTHSEDELTTMFRPTRLERKKLIDELINNIKKREEREKRREELENQQQMIREQQQQATVFALQCLTSSVSELVNQIKQMNKQS